MNYTHGVGIRPAQFRGNLFPNNAVLDRMLNVHGAPNVEQSDKHRLRVFG